MIATGTFLACLYFKLTVLYENGDWELVSQVKTLSEKELTEDVDFRNYKNLTMGIQMRPSITQFDFNETLYDEYCEIINKFSTFSVYKFKSKGLGTTKMYGGEIT